MRSGQLKESEDVVIGLDCSTTATKAIAFDRNGNVVARAHLPIPLYSPEPNYFEQDSSDWWTSAQQTLRSITRQVPPERISALAISAQRETFVPLTRDGTPLRRAIIWLDERCKDEVESFSRTIGKRSMLTITGKPADYAPVVYRLAWMKHHETSLFRKIGMICDVHAFMVWKLAKQFRTSWASADPTGLFDLRRKKWSDLILQSLELSESQLPTTYRPGTIVGKVSKEASAVTGLSTETAVVAGGGDGQAAGLGSNALAPERAYLNLGTAVVAGIYGKRYRTSKAFRTMCSCSDEGYYYECSLRAGTFAFDWFIRNILRIDPSKHSDIYRLLEEEARQVPVGSDGLFYLPYLCGVMNPYWDVDAKGAFIGLSSVHTRGHLYRSILEGIAFEQLLAVTAVERNIGTLVKEFVAIGGGAANNVWCQIMADVTGRNICIPENTEASALGAAIAAAVGSGWYRTFKEAANEMSRIKQSITPEQKSRKKYRTLFAKYHKIYPSLK